MDKITIRLEQRGLSDEYFCQADQIRLQELMAARRSSLEQGFDLAGSKLEELESLVERELLGAVRRTDAALIAEA